MLLKWNHPAGANYVNEQKKSDRIQNLMTFEVWSRFADKSEVATINRALRFFDVKKLIA